jgi:hypothetical protein
MSMRTGLAATLMLAVAVLALAPPAAEASRVVDTAVTGRVTDVRGFDTIVVEGRSYKVQPDSPAAKVIGRIRAGQIVDLVLTGEPGKDTTRVTVINVHGQP